MTQVKAEPVVEKAISFLMRLQIEQLRKVQVWLSRRIEELESLDEEFDLPPVKSGREIVAMQRSGSIAYRLEKVRCGKKSCKSCPHGPYWYGYQRRQGKVVSFYVGKVL